MQIGLSVAKGMATITLKKKGTSFEGLRILITFISEVGNFGSPKLNALWLSTQCSSPANIYTSKTSNFSYHSNSQKWRKLLTYMWSTKATWEYSSKHYSPQKSLIKTLLHEWLREPLNGKSKTQAPNFRRRPRESHCDNPQSTCYYNLL